jgi:hypothetical protein
MKVNLHNDRALTGAIFMLVVGAILIAIGSAVLFGLGVAFIVIGVAFVTFAIIVGLLA